MGIFRLLLATGVVFHHSGGWPYVINGGVAVELFFIISGFYMALVMDGKYEGKAGLFYSNRLLRLVPTYAIAVGAQFSALMLLDAAQSISRSEFMKILGHLNGASLYLGLTNLLVIGQEGCSFLSFDHFNRLQWDPWQTGGTAAWRLLLLPQAWSISFELLFYLLVPFLARRQKLIFVLFLLSFTLHTALSFSDVPFNAWGRRFFPSIFHFFLLGMLAYYLSSRHVRILRSISPLIAYFGVALLLGAAVLLRSPTANAQKFGYPILSFFTAAWLPVLFYSVRFKFDRELGELSYPVYMLHVLVLGLCVKVLGLSGLTLNVAALSATMLLSFALYKVVDERLDRWRQSRVSAHAAPAKISSGPLDSLQ